MQQSSWTELESGHQEIPSTCPGDPCLSTVRLVRSIAEAVVRQKHLVHVTCRPNERGRTLILTVSPEDHRVLVGGQARTVESMRTIVQSIGMRHQQRFHLHIATEETPN